MGRERVDAGHGEQRAEAEGQGGRVPHLGTGGADRLRQILAAPLRRRGKRVPTRLRPGAIRLFPSRRRRHRAVVEPRALPVTDHIEGSEDVGRELAGLLEHGIDQILAEIAVEAFLERALEPARVLEREGDIGDRRPVGHGVLAIALTARNSRR